MIGRRFTLGSTLLAGVATILLAPLACQDPTQVKVTITTGDGVCGAVSAPDDKHTELFAAGPGDPPGEARGRVDGCSGPSLGTVTLVPSDRGGDVLLEVAMALAPGKAPADCRADAKGCIVARRRVGYVTHRSLSLQIPLDRSCIGVSCDPASTCFAGACRPADVVCSGSSCELTASDAGPPIDAATPVDATPTSDAGFDAGSCPKLPDGAGRLTALGTSLVYVAAGGTTVHSLDPLGNDQVVIGPFDPGEVILAIAAGGGNVLAATSSGIYAPPGITRVATPTSTVEQLALVDEVTLAFMWLSSGKVAFGPTGSPQFGTDYRHILGGKSTFFAAKGTTGILEYDKTGSVVGGAYTIFDPPVAMAPALGGRFFWSDGVSLRVSSVNPPKTDFTEPIADVRAMGSSGDRVALAVPVAPGSLPVGSTWGYDVAITRLTASGFAPPSKVAGVRGAGPAPAIVDVAIAGSCVYLASGGRGAVGRAPF